MSVIEELSVAIDAIDQNDFSNSWTRLASSRFPNGGYTYQMSEEEAAEYEKLAISFSSTEQKARKSVDGIISHLNDIENLIDDALRYIDNSLVHLANVYDKDVESLDAIYKSIVQVSIDLSGLSNEVERFRKKLKKMC